MYQKSTCTYDFVEIGPFSSADKSPTISSKLNLSFLWKYLSKDKLFSNLTNLSSHDFDRLTDQKQCLYNQAKSFHDISFPTNRREVTYTDNTKNPLFVYLPHATTIIYKKRSTTLDQYWHTSSISRPLFIAKDCFKTASTILLSCHAYTRVLASCRYTNRQVWSNITSVTVWNWRPILAKIDRSNDRFFYKYPSRIQYFKSYYIVQMLLLFFKSKRFL